MSACQSAEGQETGVLWGNAQECASGTWSRRRSGEGLWLGLEVEVIISESEE